MLRWSPVELASRIVKSKPITYNFATGSPDPSLIPIDEVRRSFENVIERYGVSTLAYPGAGGLKELRIEVSRYLSRALGIEVGWRNIIITSGAQHAIKLLSQLLMRRRTVVYTENPTFVETVMPMRFQGVRLVGVPLDDEGLNVYELERLVKIHGSGIVYVIPNCHNPTGVSMSMDRRKYLIELSEGYGLTIIEDDPYTPISHEKTTPLRALSDGVIYVGSFSKVLGPGLRIGFLVITDNVLRSRVEMLEQHDFSTSTLTQYIVYDMLRRGVIYRAMEKADDVYKLKLNTLIDALSRYMPGALMYKPHCGFYTFVNLGRNAWDVLKESVRYGIAFVPGDGFYVEKPIVTSARLSIGTIPIDRIEEGIRLLSDVVGRG
ncbi:aminotransferase-like domain-containing protein [Vulcanisaeta thermophila]|uniref:aminotransferase-like domain-containing protein n=1 Tax=Vulcanisaeta thermophila TaxID=867917 RepID=UPI0008533173|nr:PLP-dependent aminotransferase family protein [Vulcanisaeta thermophila]